MKILLVSDRVDERLYDPEAYQRFVDIDLILSCGDLPYYYLEFLIDALDAPLYFVRGNHAADIECGEHVNRTKPAGAVDLHRKTCRHQGLLLGGFEGSVRYRAGKHQYTQSEMWSIVLRLMPKLLWNRVAYGRWLDVLVTHSPPWGINDQQDRAHQGFKALRWLLKVFKPAYHFHGHVHVYSSTKKVETMYQKTCVINCYGYKQMELDVETITTRFQSGERP